MIRALLGLAAVLMFSACSQEESSSNSDVEQVANASDEQIEIAPGLKSTTTFRGYGRVAVPGDIAEMHYTGWLYDPDAEGGRGKKFDSSVDRGETFPFRIGEGRVIKGWDQGVAGMLIGEKRELLIEPAMAYGERGRPPIIPPNSTLLFEVELRGLQGPSDESDNTE